MWSWILQFLGGLWFFLFWMNYLEQAVSSITKWGFKNLLKRFTSSVRKSFWSGILITTILESSNVVSVLVLAFVWTWVLSLSSALAVILWSNVGTWITASLLWIVWLSLNVAKIALPLIFFGAVWLSFFSRSQSSVILSKFFLSFWMIFLAFSFMKEWLGFLTDSVDFSEFLHLSPWIFFLIGLWLTVLIQSGSIIFIISLALVSSGILPANLAFPMVFASYLWCTITIILWAMWSNKVAAKKQVALWHVFFNLIISVVWVFAMPLIMVFYEFLLAHLWSVISFTIIYFSWRTLFALAFIPLVRPASKLLEKIIKDSGQEIKLAVQKIFNVEELDPTVAQWAVKQDMLLLFRNAIKYNLNVWDFSPVTISKWESTEEDIANTLAFKWNFDKNDLSKVYRDMKYIQNELLGFLVSLPVSDKSQENSELYQSVLSAWDSCKVLKDVWTHIEDWQWSSSDNLQRDYELTREMVLRFYSAVLHLYQRFDSKKALTDAQEILEDLQRENDAYLLELRPHKSDDIPLTSLIQTRRYLGQSCKDLLHAMELYKAGPDEVKYFKENMALFMK